MDKFTSKHLAFVVVGVVVVSLKSYPSLMTRNGGRDTWIAMGVGCLFALLYFLFMLHIFKKSNYKNFSSIYNLALGKRLGRIFLWLFLATLFLTLIESASVEANSMHTNMLYNIKPWQYLLFFIPPALYTVKKGTASVMTITLISMVLVSLSGINLSILTAPYKHIDYIFPIFAQGITPGIIRATLQILGLYGCVSIIFPYMKDIKEKSKLIKHLLIAMIFVLQMEFVAMTGIIMTFEIDFLNTMAYPKLLQTQLISQLDFLEFGELFVMLQIVGGWFVKYVLTLFAIIKLVEGMDIKTRNIGYWISGLCFVVASYVSNNLFRLFNYLNFYTYICLINLVFIPFFIFLIYALRGFPESEISDIS